MYKKAETLCNGPNGSPSKIVNRQTARKTFYPSRPLNDWYAKSYIYQVAVRWNQQDPDIQISDKAKCFRNTLKRRLLNVEREVYYGNEP